jgi:hypothetical protein
MLSSFGDWIFCSDKVQGLAVLANQTQTLFFCTLVVASLPQLSKGYVGCYDVIVVFLLRVDKEEENLKGIVTNVMVKMR